MGELFKAYESIGIRQIHTNTAVKFFTGVTYWVWGRATAGSNDVMDHSQPSDSEHWRQLAISWSLWLTHLKAIMAEDLRALPASWFMKVWCSLS
jgi:hypothetical protein